MLQPDKTSAAPELSAPRNAIGWAALAYAIATLALAYPAPSGRFLVHPISDEYIAGFAFRDFAVQSLLAGQGISHWNPFMFGGLPYVAAMHGDSFYSSQLLRLLVGTDSSMTWGFVIHMFLVGLFTYGFLRACGLGFWSALIGGIAYQLSGPIASYAAPGDDAKLFVSSLLPLTLWLLLGGTRDGRRSRWGALALAVGLAVLSPHPQLLQHLFLILGSFALFLAFSLHPSGHTLDRRTALLRLGYGLGAVCVGLAIGAIQFAPPREDVPFSPRAGGRSYAFATNFSCPLNELFNMYLPQFTGILDRYSGDNAIHFQREYISAPVLILATLGLWSARTAFKRFWIATGIVALLWARGGNTPFFHLLYALVPGTKFFQAPSTIIYVFAFPVSVLAALAVEGLSASVTRARVALVWSGFALVVALAATEGVVTSFAESQARANGIRRGDDAPSAQRYGELLAEKARDNSASVVAGAWWSFIFTAIVSAVTLVTIRGRSSRTRLGVALTLIVALDCWSVVRQDWMFSSPARALYASDPAVELLKKEKEPGRVVVRALSAEGLAHPDPYFGTNNLGRRSGLMVHGIRSITGYHGNELGRYQQLSEAQLRPAVPVMMTRGFWRQENAKYLYTNVALPNSQLRLMVGPVTNSAGSTVDSYRLPGGNPYAWVPSAMTKAPNADVTAAELDPRFDPLRFEVLDSAALVSVAPLNATPAPSTLTAATSNYGPERASLALSAPATFGSALVISESFFPGSSATVDGKAQPVYRTNFNPIGVPLEACAKSVEITFHDHAVERGQGVTVIGRTLSIMALLGGAIADRRQRV